MEVEVSEDFKRLHLLTMMFTKGNDSSVVDELRKILTQIDEPTLCFAKPYVLMEICKSLKEATKSDRKFELVSTAQVLIDKTPGDSIQQGGLFKILVDIISLDHTKYSEELFIASLNCMITICEKCPLEIKRHLYIKTNAPFLGKTIYSATQLARKHPCLEIKFLSMKYVLSICHLDNLDFLSNDKEYEFRYKIAEVLMLFLPGVVAACQEVAIYNVKKQHKVTVLALRIWGRIIALVMEDSKIKDDHVPTVSDFLNLAKTESEEQEPKAKPKPDWAKSGTSGILEYLNESKRTDKWMQETSLKISRLFPHLIPIITHERQEVRLELVACCELILKQAWRNCGVCKSELLAILFSLSRDEVESISKASETAIVHMVKNQSSSTIARVIELTLHKRIKEMPNCINLIDENALMSSLDFIIGTVKNLGQDSSNLFTPQLQENLLDVLTIIVQIDVAAVSLEENSPDLFFNMIDNLNHLYVKKLPPFRHICDSDEKIIEKVKLLCSYLGSSNARYILDILFTRIECSINTLESVMLSTFILKNSNAELLNICNNMLTYWQYDNIWYLPTEIKPDKPGGPNYKSWYFSDHTPGLYEGSLEVRYTDVSTAKEEEEDRFDPDFCKNLYEVKYNSMLIALQCEAVGVLAVSMQSNFRRFFLKYLYLIIEKCGHQKQIIQNSALTAVKDFQIYSNVNSLSELIDVNADYLVNSISIKLNHIINYNAPDTGVLDALVIVLENCTSPKHLKSFSEVIKKVEQLNFKQKDFIISLLKVYRAFVSQLVSIYGSQPEKKVEKKKSLLIAIKEIQAALQIEKEALNEEFSTNDQNIPDNIDQEYPEVTDNIDYDIQAEDSDKVPAPEHVTLASSILKRSVPFISSSNNTHRLLALDVVYVGLPLLSEHEDTLLPALHEIWNPVASRLRGNSDAEIKVLRRAFSVACSLASLGKDFLRQRAISSVLSEALKFLESTAQNVKPKFESSDSYKLTQLFKLQFEVISSLGKLCSNLRLGEKTRYEVMVALYKYIHKDSKPELREAAKLAFLEMAEDNPADVCYFLASIWPLEALPCEVQCHNLSNYCDSVLEIDKMIAAKWC